MAEPKASTMASAVANSDAGIVTAAILVIGGMATVTAEHGTHS
jgi:hypothetical protein